MAQCGGHGTVVVGSGGELTPLVYETRSLPKVRREAVRGQYLYGSGVVSFTDEQASFRVEVTVRTKTISGAAGIARAFDLHAGTPSAPLINTKCKRMQKSKCDLVALAWVRTQVTYMHAGQCSASSLWKLRSPTQSADEVSKACISFANDNPTRAVASTESDQLPMSARSFHSRQAAS